MINKSNYINELIILGSGGYLALSFIKYFYFNFEQFKTIRNISLILFTSDYKKIQKFFELNDIDFTSKFISVKFFKYSQFKEVIKGLNSYVIFNFSGYNIFKALFSLYNYNYKNNLIWQSRIDFTNKLINDIIEIGNYPLMFLLPSAVWVYSESKLSNYFYQWEDTLNLLSNNSYKVVFRLGIVLDENSSWLKILNYFFKLNIKPVFNKELAFPYIYLQDFFKITSNLLNFNYDLSKEKLNIFDLFVYSTFNDFIDYMLSKNYSSKKFINFYISDYLMDLFFKDYYRAMFLKSSKDFATFATKDLKDF